MLGIPDPWVVAAYVGCILMAILCLIYGALRRNAAADELTDIDRHWAIDERNVEDER